jgi:hypothetical protein
MYPVDGTSPITDQFGSVGRDMATGVAADADGNVWVVGYTTGAIGGSNLGHGDLFLRKYRADSFDPLTVQLGTAGDDYARGVAVDDAGTVWVAGATDGEFSATNQGGSDVFVWKDPVASSNEDVIQFGTAEDDVATAIAIGPDGGAWVSGYTLGALQGENQGTRDAFLRSVPVDGSQVRTYQFGTAELDEATSVALDLRGNLWVAGSTEGTLGPTSGGSSDGFARVYPADGGAARSFQFGTDKADTVVGVAADASGNAWVVGHTAGQFDGETANVYVRQIAH